MSDKVDIVLYSYNNRPLVDLVVSESLIRYIEKNRSFRIAMLPPFKVTPCNDQEVIQIIDITIQGGRRYNTYDNCYVWVLKFECVGDSNFIEEMFAPPQRYSDRYYDRNHFRDRDRFIDIISNLSLKS
jgi:hypothetical protein